MERTKVSLQTNQGNMEFELYDDLAPETCRNFRKLVSEGFYDGVRFNKIARGHSMETGDPLSKDILEKLNWGTGGPGYSLKREDAKLSHDKKGLLSMMSEGDEISGSRFMVTVKPLPHLDGKNVVFGHMTKGNDVLDIIGDMGTDRGGKVEFIGYIMIEKINVL